MLAVVDFFYLLLFTRYSLLVSCFSFDVSRLAYTVFHIFKVNPTLNFVKAGSSLLTQKFSG